MSTPIGPVLSDQARTLLGSQPEWPAWTVPLDERRRASRAFALEHAGPAEQVVAVEMLDAGGVPARLYRPRGGEHDVFLWFHGGGWCLGDLDGYDAVCCAIANRAGCAVVSVDYRLAPEHPYPAAIDDCWAATRWAAERFERLAVGGDSAGGNLAAAVALRARDVQLPLVLQLLVYPVLDAGLDTPFVDDFVARYAVLGAWEGYGPLAREGIRRTWDDYVPDRARQLEPDAAPARTDSLAGVAPVLALVTEHDLLRGEAEAYVQRLVAEGVAAELYCYPGQVHGFFNLLAAMDDAHDAMERSAAALRRAFA
jgi:acetyl esterase